MNESGPPKSDEEASGTARGPDDAGRGAAGDVEDEHRIDESPGTEPGEPTETENAGDTADTDADGGKAEADDDTTGSGGQSGGWVWRAFAVVALVAALATATGAAYLFQRLEALEARVADVPEARAEALASLRKELDVGDRLDAMEGALGDESRAREKLAGRVEQDLERLAASIADVRELAGGHHTRWRLAEVRYLIGVGVRRLQLAGDAEGAAAAFEAADEALHRLGDPRLLPLRSALVEDIERIRAIEPADIEGIALRLYNLERRVDRLPLAGAGETTTEEVAADGDPDDPLWRRLIERLRALVVIRHREAGPTDGMPAEAEALPAREALKLALGRARRAAMARDADRYESALASASELVERHFAGDSAPVERLAEALAALGDRPVRTPVPDLSATLDKAAELTARIEAEREQRVEPGAESADDGGDTGED